MKRKKISLDRAIDKYYNRHKVELDSVFGSEASAKSHLEYDTSLNGISTVDPKRATKVFNEYMEVAESTNPDLTFARQEAGDISAVVKDLGKKNARGMNKKFGQTPIQDGIFLGIDSKGYETTLIEHYDIAGSNYALCHIGKKANYGSKSSSFTYWSYELRSAMGI